MKKIVVTIMTILAVLGMGTVPTYAAQNEESHTIDEYTYLGEMIQEIDPEVYSKMDLAERLYWNSFVIEDSQNDVDEFKFFPAGNSAITKALPITGMYTLSANSGKAGCIYVGAHISTSQKCPSLSVYAYIYDITTGYIVKSDSSISVGSSNSETISKNFTGLNSGKKYKVVANYYAVAPSGYNPPTIATSKQKFVVVK